MHFRHLNILILAVSIPTVSELIVDTHTQFLFTDTGKLLQKLLILSHQYV